MWCAPIEVAYMPVISAARLGAQTPEVANAFSKRVPSAASRSTFGVRASGSPYAPISRLTSSATIQTTFGRLATSDTPSRSLHAAAQVRTTAARTARSARIDDVSGGVEQRRELRALLGRVPEELLGVLLALEPDVHVALPGEADAAVQLHRAVGRERARIRRGGLRHAREPQRVRGILVERAGRGVGQRARAVDRQHDVDQRVLDGLEEADRPLELHAGARGSAGAATRQRRRDPRRAA